MERLVKDGILDSLHFFLTLTFVLNALREKYTKIRKNGASMAT